MLSLSAYYAVILMCLNTVEWDLDTNAFVANWVVVVKMDVGVRPLCKMDASKVQEG